MTETRNILELAALIVTPIAGITALLLYFGWNRQNAIYGYFGIDQAVLKFSPQDYLLRSAGVIFKPVAIIIACLLLINAARRFTAQSGGWLATYVVPIGRKHNVSVATILRIVISLPSLGTAVAALFGRMDPLMGAGLLALGTLIGAPLFQSRERSPGERLIVGLTIAFATFWALAVYGSRSGTALAEYINEHPDARAAVIVHSETRLSFSGDSVTETKVPSGEGKTRYRYTGLRLFAYANGHWVLIEGRLFGHARLMITLLNDNSSTTIEMVR